MRMKRSEGALALAIMIAGALSFSSCLPKIDLKGVKWEDIKSWRAVGTRWAEALDANGNTIAVYDLSYPAITDELGELALGRIGEGKVTSASIIKLLDPPPEQIDDGSKPQATSDQIASAIAALQKNNLSDRLPDGWWKTLKWKSTTTATATAAPESFTLDDIDWAAMASDKSKFQSDLNSLTSQPEEPGESPALGGSGFFASFHFQRDDATGAYAVSWNPSASAKAATPSRPEKLVDLTNPQLGWWDELIWDGISDGVGDLVGLIPLPVAQAILQTTVGLFFQYEGQMKDAHLRMLLEDLAPIDSGVGLSGLLSDLDAAQAKAVEISATYSTSGEAMPALWFALNQDVSQFWGENRLQEDNTAIRETTWLRANATLGEALGPRNSLVQGFPGVSGAPATGTSGIAVVADQPSSKHPEPLLAIDYTQPDRIYDYRVVINDLAIAVSFACNFIPYVGSYVDDVFTDLFVNPISSAQDWEARLKAVLETSAGEDWSPEIDTVDHQALNPFELDRQASADLIARRKQWLGM